MSSEKPTILVVDDEKDNLDLLMRALSKSYEVQAFSNPKDALEAAVAAPPAAVVTDYRMPDLNGVELVKALRERGIDCAALMVTAFPDLDDVVVAAETKLIFHLIAKPWRPQMLLEQTARAIHSYRFEKATAKYRELKENP